MYRINEGTLNLPHGWHDRSINVITSALSGSATTVTIARDDIPWGMDFAEFVDSQGELAANELKEYTLLDRRELRISRAPAIEFEATWISPQGRVHQIITSLKDGQKVMVLTASVPGQMSDNQKAELRHMISTLQLDPRRG